MPPAINRREALKLWATGLAASAAESLADPLPCRAESGTATMRPADPWLGIHLELASDQAADALTAQLPALSARGVNVLVVEVDYSFEFTSRPELRASSFIARAKARHLADACRHHHVRLIPQLNCLGHQSWKSNTFPLLTRYPEFDETPGKFAGNEGIYCRSWCPLHPEINPVIFALMDDLIDGFESDALHVGMDEVFLIASEFCPRCRGRDPAELFAKAVNDFFGHLVGQRHVEMLMWGDRLLDGKATGYGKWEASENGTFPAIDKISKDVVICDWHYEKRGDYPSIGLFVEKGFRVWPTGWKDVDATESLTDCELKHRKEKNGKMLGHLCSTWGSIGIDQMADWPPVLGAMKKWAGLSGGTDQLPR